MFRNPIGGLIFVGIKTVFPPKEKYTKPCWQKKIKAVEINHGRLVQNALLLYGVLDEQDGCWEAYAVKKKREL